jgi:hypothetical protein
VRFFVINGLNSSGQCYLWRVVLIPDGGFVAVGQINCGDTSTQDTWLIRVDSMGCVTPGCNPYTGIIENNIAKKVKLLAYPNPFGEEVTVRTQLERIGSNATLRFMEITTGKVLFEKVIFLGEQYTVFNTSQLSSEVYLIELIRQNTAPEFLKLVHLK